MEQKSRIERLDAFMKYKGMNDNQMTVKCGLGVGLLGKARGKKSKLGEGTILKVSKAFPEVNVDWLLNGEGCMLNGSTTGGAVVTSEPCQDYTTLRPSRNELTRILAEITAQRKLTEQAMHQLAEEKEQSKRLISIIERLTGKPL